MIKRVSKKLLNRLVMNKWTIKSFNKIYENAPDVIVHRLEPALAPPSFDYCWQIVVDDRVIHFTYRKGERRVIFHFPLSYKKNDPPIRQLERILHQHYPLNVPFMDIGANFGLRSLYYLAHDRFCILFEPNQECNQITQRLLQENNLSNAKVVNKMVGNENKTSEFFLSRSTYVSSASKDHVDRLNDFKETVDVEQITIDSFLELERLQDCVKFAKIDVEGYEFEVCDGARKFLGSQNVSLLIEVLPCSKESVRLFSLLQAKGHKIFRIKKGGKLKMSLCEDGFDSPDGSIDYFTTSDKALIKKLRQFISDEVN